MIRFEDWALRTDGKVLAQQFDNLTRTLVVTGEIPDEWEWAMLVRLGEAMDILPLTAVQDGIGIVLTAEQLSQSGYYTMQLRATRGELVRHTNTICVYVAASLSGDKRWPVVPSAFTELERRTTDAAQKAEEAASRAESHTAHPPLIGENSNWWSWDGTRYVDTGKPSQGELTHVQGNALYAGVLKGMVSGATVWIDDMSPLEHVMSVRVGSKNLFDYKDFVAWVNSGIGSSGSEGVTFMGEECFSFSIWQTSIDTLYTKIKFKSNTQYTFSFESASGGTSKACFLVWYTDGSYSQVRSPSNQANAFFKTVFTSEYGKSIAGITIERNDSTNTRYIKKTMQIEEGTVATEYVPCIPLSAAHLFVYGKNLLNPSEYMPDSSQTTLDGDVFTTNFTNAGYFFNTGWSQTKTKTMPKGTYTVTFIPASEGARATIHIRTFANQTLIAQLQNAGTDAVGYSVTFTANEDWFVSLGGPSSSLRGTHSYKLQVEIGSSSTQYEPYHLTTYEPTEGGVFEVMSSPQIMGMTADAPNAIVECEYNRDINKAFEQLTQAIISMGGNI